VDELIDEKIKGLGFVGEAPQDNLIYSRKNASWVLTQNLFSPWTTDGTSWVNNNNISPSVVINNTNSLFGSDQAYPIELNTGSGALTLSNNSGTSTSIDVSDPNATYINTLDLSNKLHRFTMYKEIDNSYIKLIVSDNECLFIDPGLNPINGYFVNDS
jgi:hypothetical protein